MMAAGNPRRSGERPDIQPAFGFGPRPGFAHLARPDDPRATLLRLWHYLRRQRWQLVAVLLLVLLTTVLGLLGPLLWGMAADRIVALDLTGLARIALLMLATYVALSAATWLQTVLMVRISQATVRDLRRDLFAVLQTLPLRFFDERSIGDLMSRMTNDIENVNTVLSTSVASFLTAIITLPAVIVLMLALNPPLALVSLTVVPMIALATRAIVRRSRQGFRDQQAALGTLNGMIEETAEGGKVIVAYGLDDVFVGKFDEANARLREAAIRASTFSGLMGPVGNMISNLSFAIVAGVGGVMAVAGMATVGTIVSFLGYSEQLRRPVVEIASLFNTIQAALAGAERVFAVMDEPAEEQESRGAEEQEGEGALGPIEGWVAFEDVSFGYRPETPVLKHVNLAAAPGQTIALVGPTGAGKTTLINLLSRFYDVDAGSICIDGRDIRTAPKDDLRRQLGVVLQDTYLFSRSVMENIRYGRLDATDDEVYAAASLANADHFIRRLPEGYDTVLSERGGNLSQGQCQLLAIARAVLADPRILVLDEATSSVDTRTELHIQEALLRLMQGRTSFVIAHRLSTIRDADLILVIRDGEIVEQGTHEALLAGRGFYHQLYTGQFRGVSLQAGVGQGSAST
jgi:ATP-binding cassette subfamily B protein